MASQRRVIIVGGGNVGADLATLLLDKDHAVSVIEIKPDRVVRLQHDLPAGVVLSGDGTDPALLRNAGMQQAQVVAAVTGADETNLVITNLARFQFRVPRTIARVNHPRNAWMFTPEMGVDVALNQSDLMAHLIIEEMSLGDMMTLLKLRTGQYSLIEERVHPQSLSVGKTIRDLGLPEECVFTAIIREGQLLVPRGTTIIQAGDEVLAVVHATQMEQLAAILGDASSA